MFTVWLPTAYSIIDTFEVYYIDRPVCQRRTVSGQPYQRFVGPECMADDQLYRAVLGMADYSLFLQKQIPEMYRNILCKGVRARQGAMQGPRQE